MTNTTLTKLNKRRARVRSRVIGSATRPRLTVKISLVHIIAQIIDDERGQTLAYITTVGKDLKGTMTDKAIWTGEQIAALAKSKKITKVVFDRNGRIYHGRLKALAETARQHGLEF